MKPFNEHRNPTKEYIDFKKNKLQYLKDELSQMTYHKDEWENKQEYLDHKRDLERLIAEEDQFISRTIKT